VIGQDSKLARMRAWFVAVMAAMVFLPLVEGLTHFVPYRSIDENRSRAAPPNWRLLLSANSAGAFADALNRWVDDRIGFRDLLIRVKNQIDYSLLRVSRKVYLGSDGWLFDRIRTDARTALERMSDPEIAALEHRYDAFAEALKRRHIRLIVVGYLDKSILYAEHLPADAPTFPRGGKVAAVFDYLRDDPNFSFIDTERLLAPEKSAGPLYYRTDVHINIPGSIPIVAAIVARIAALEGRPDIAWREHFDLHTYRWTGGYEDRALALLRPLGEQISGGNLDDIGKDTPDGHWINKDPRLVTYPGGFSFPIFDWEVVSNPELCAARLPVTALFGDSFSDPYWSLGLQHYFCSLRRARTTPSRPPSGNVRLPAYVDDLPPTTRYLILQFTTTYLADDAPPAAGYRDLSP
jgi:hypothetical protein